jgi:hypothetical protein
MDEYNRFLAFEVVVNIKTKEEFDAFVQRCKECRLNTIVYLAKHGYDKLLNNCYPKYTNDQFCVEYQLSKGFTIGDKDSYIKWGCEVISVEDFLKATKYVG